MITTILLIQCIGLLLLLISSAFFSSSETCLFSLNSLQIEQLKSRSPAAGRRVEDLLNQPTKLLSTILIGNTIVNVASASLGYSILATMQIQHAAIVAIPSMTLILLIFGEVVPKRIAMRYAQRMAASYAGLLLFFIRLLMPLRFALEKTASLFAKNLHTTDNTLTED
jgi:putative hemolysin